MPTTEQPSYLASLIADYRQTKVWLNQNIGTLPTMVMAAVAAEIAETEQALRTVYAPTNESCEEESDVSGRLIYVPNERAPANKGRLEYAHRKAQCNAARCPPAMTSPRL